MSTLEKAILEFRDAYDQLDLARSRLDGVVKPIAELITEAGKEVCKSKDSALAFLIKIGILKEDGTLSVQYGGEED